MNKKNFKKRLTKENITEIIAGSISNSFVNINNIEYNEATITIYFEDDIEPLTIEIKQENLQENIISNF